MPRPMFQFALWPIDEVPPWENPDGSRFLHWYGLTDGWYTINVGGAKLLKYSQRLIEATPDWRCRTPYFEYNVAQLHQDLLELLPEAIDPVPPDIAELVRTPYLETEFEEHCTDIEEGWPSERSDSFWDRAAEWWFNRRLLNGGHLKGQPQIRIWSEEDTLHMRWRSEGEVEPQTGLSWSDVEDGIWTMPRSQFIEEVRSFHQRLIDEMAVRLEIARTAWPLPDVAIDLEELSQAHGAYARTFDEALAKAGQTDWDDVRDLINRHMR